MDKQPPPFTNSKASQMKSYEYDPNIMMNENK